MFSCTVLKHDVSEQPQAGQCGIRGICTCYLTDYLVRLGFRTVYMSKRTSTLGDESESHAVCATSNHTYNACVYDAAVGFPVTQFVCTVDSGHLNDYDRRIVGTHCNRTYAGSNLCTGALSITRLVC